MPQRRDTRRSKRFKGLKADERQRESRRVKATLRQLATSGELGPDYNRAHRIMRRAYGQKALCAYCGRRGSTADHLTAKALGGADETGNLVPACHRCNNAKGMMTPREWFTMHPAHAATFLSVAVHAHPHVRQLATQIMDLHREQRASQGARQPVSYTANQT